MFVCGGSEPDGSTLNDFEFNVSMFSEFHVSKVFRIPTKNIETLHRFDFNV